MNLTLVFVREHIRFHHRGHRETTGLNRGGAEDAVGVEDSEEELTQRVNGAETSNRANGANFTNMLRPWTVFSTRFIKLDVISFINVTRRTLTSEVFIEIFQL